MRTLFSHTTLILTCLLLHDSMSFLVSISQIQRPSFAGISGSASAPIDEGAHETLFDSFDYSSHWYPVIWARDVPLNQPIRVTLFDVPYVIARTTVPSPSNNRNENSKQRNAIVEEEEVFYAMIDSCPHKRVALSEGRITHQGSPGKRYLQCSYHGWTFDRHGKCVEIPQTALSAATTTDSATYTYAAKRKREDATAVAVTQVQGMVWIHPSLTPLEALTLTHQGKLPQPPRVPEVDLPGYKTTTAIRDLPIDWTVIIENIMDPDHGYFAHARASTGKAFDWYTSDGKYNLMEVTEKFFDDHAESLVKESKTSLGWKITSSVNAVEKLIKYDREVRRKLELQSPPTSSMKSIQPKLATATFFAPSLITLGRRQDTTSPSQFVTAFWICPAGTGKSRFMSAAISKSPISIPRWLVHLNLNNFLDQDTFLLVGQNKAVLKREAQGYIQPCSDVMEYGKGKSLRNDVRKMTYVYRSPSEKIGLRLGQFFDATLARVPNRKDALMAWYGKFNNDEWPSREMVLDRYKQHTKICPDSMKVIKNCDKIMTSSKVIGVGLLIIKMLFERSPVSTSSFVLSTSQKYMRVMWENLFHRVPSILKISLIQGNKLCPIIIILSLLHWIASLVKKEFFFKYDEELHRKDIASISKNWIDL